MLSNYQSIFSFALCSALCTVALAKPHPQHRHGGGWGPPAPVATSTPAVAAATAATSAASPATSSGTTTTSSSGAVSGKGLIYYSGPPLSAYNAADLAFSLDWADTAAADGASLGTFVPMCSGLAQVSSCTGVVTEGQSVVGFNEPENPAEAFMLPTTAVSNWGPINDLRASKGAKIGTPAVSNAGGPDGTTATVSANGVENNPQGITWLSQFLANATTEGYTFDFVAYHWYEGDQSDLLAQTSAMQKLAKQYKIDTVLVTEMGFNDPSTECSNVEWLVNNFIATSGAAGYAYSTSTWGLGNTLMSSSGVLTDVGTA
ncbi:hypothetical protein IMSHALPRED_010116 [Imshaugia aleurites]|uniref:Asl1-like glycosyl hydrolase catalytic domain-containing protein n=1 Tax=Imshaugia aleurites TaxID=172621 RepID=A0A8H3IZG2_9LECA|nr:hypothetical protein IMSHALPRED_010116 [Imshaugia aleurites]